MKEPHIAPMVPLWPNYVMNMTWDKGEEWNKRLFDIAIIDHDKHLIKNEADPRNTAPLNVGHKDVANYYNQVRHNIFLDQRDPVIAEYAKMVEYAVRKFMRVVFKHNPESITMTSDALYQQRHGRDNVGIHGHNHWRHDIVCTYYPLVEFEDEPTSPKHAGQVRFYDPADMGKRLWPNSNPVHHFSSWYGVVPKTGTMLIFEGRLFHDSTFFEGTRRMCIPVMCQIPTANRHIYATSEEIAKFQEG